jgi:hypothetical protein
MAYEPDGPRYDHLQARGETGCDDFEPMPRGKINGKLPRGTSVECRRCSHSVSCALGGIFDDSPDDDRDQLDEPDDEAERRARGIYPMGTT